MSDTVFISGVAGFLGSHCAQKALDKGMTVIGVDNLSGGDYRNVPERINRFINSDICDFDKMARIFQSYQPKYVIHCAAYAAENLSHNLRAYTYRNNIAGTANLVSMAVRHDVECFVNLSSIAVYGDSHPPFYEDQRPTPADPYGNSKASSETDLEIARSFFGLNYVNHRPHNIIGTHQNMADSTRNVASIFIRQALEGKPLTVFGDGMQTRGFSPVSQVSSIIVDSLGREDCYGHTFNVGSDSPVTVYWLANRIIELTGSESAIQFLEARKETVQAEANHAKVRLYFPEHHNGGNEVDALLGCLKEMIFEARTREMRPMMKLPDLEVAKNLPEVWAKQYQNT